MTENDCDEGTMTEGNGSRESLKQRAEILQALHGETGMSGIL